MLFILIYFLQSLVEVLTWSEQYLNFLGFSFVFVFAVLYNINYGRNQINFLQVKDSEQSLNQISQKLNVLSFCFLLSFNCMNFIYNFNHLLWVGSWKGGG